MSLVLLLAGDAAQAADACKTVLEARVQHCVDDCVASARAAVDPDLRDQVSGLGCRTNCIKIEMFNGHTCPPS